MSFNDNIRLDPNRVRTSRGGKGAVVGGIGGVGALVVLALYLFTGQDFSALLGADTQTTAAAASGISLDHCTTGTAANEYVECRMVATAESLDALWSEALPQQAEVAYQQPDFMIFSDAVSTACGAATSAVGPFYCPGDSTVYLDVSFFDTLQTQLGAENAPLAQEYIVAHEWGHHIQNLLGTMSQIDQTATGATSDSVRLELQADCYAGLWVGHAASTVDPETGTAFLTPPTSAQISDALDAAAAVGDDRIQEKAQGRADPDSFTHGTSEQRVHWFTTGMNQGTIGSCDTFAATDLG